MDLYYFNITPLRNRDVYERELKNIDQDRVDAIDRLRMVDDKLRCLGGGIITRFVKEAYGIGEELAKDKFGKPYFEGSDVHFNISHSGSYVVCAVSNYDIGIDIQRMQKDKHRVAEKNFVPSECEYINSDTNDEKRHQRFCEIWTVKEAYLKNIGIGLRKPLNSFEVAFNGLEPHIVGQDEYRFVQLKMDENYIIAVCANKKDVGFNMEEITI